MLNPGIACTVRFVAYVIIPIESSALLDCRPETCSTAVQRQNEDDSLDEANYERNQSA